MPIETLNKDLWIKTLGKETFKEVEIETLVKVVCVAYLLWTLFIDTHNKIVLTSTVLWETM